MKIGTVLQTAAAVAAVMGGFAIGIGGVGRWSGGINACEGKVTVSPESGKRFWS